jgi:hypothetical protein
MSAATETTLEAPFIGLRYFDEEQSHLFFGRDMQTNDILEKLRRSRLVTVMGSSGSGKSSLVRAGMVPSLRAGFLSDAGPRWRIVKMRPGSSPILNLGRELEKALSVPGLEVTLRRGPLGLVQAVEECRLPVKENVLVIADQFEELFRYQRESEHPEAAKEEAAAFVKLLLEATNQRTVPIHVVMTMRSDYLGNCAQFRDLPERINDGLYLVPRMRRDQLEQAIIGPVAVEDAAIASRLVQRLLNDTGDDPDQLPVLQHALLRAWNTWKHAPRLLDLDDLDAVGGMKESLSRHADEIFEWLSADQQRIARIIFQQLCDRDTEGREIRRPAPIAHIAAVAGVTVQAVDDVVKPFAAADAALLYRNEDGHLDITHESLIRKWRLIQGSTPQGSGEAKGWLQEEVEARDQFQTLVERASKKDTLMGRALEDALRWRALGLNAAWAGRYTKETTGVDTTLQSVLLFIVECQTKEERRRHLRNGVAGATLLAVAVFILVIFTLYRSAVTQRRESESRASAALALEKRWLDPASATKDAIHALQSPTLEGLSAAREVLQESNVLAVWRHSQFAQVTAAGFSADGEQVVLSTAWGSAWLWTWKGCDERTFANYPMLPLRGTSISPDTKFVLSQEKQDGRYTMVIRSRDGGQEALRFGSQSAPITAAAYDPSLDRQYVATGSADATVKLWDLNGDLLEPLKTLATSARPGEARVDGNGHTDIVTSVRFAAADASGHSTDDAVISASQDGRSKVWHWKTGVVETLRAKTWMVFDSAANPRDSRTVASGNLAGDLFIWTLLPNPRTGEYQNFRRLFAHKYEVRQVGFSTDGTYIVTASSDGTAKVLDWKTGREVQTLQGHHGAVTGADFSPNGKEIVTSSVDGTVRVWRNAPPVDFSQRAPRVSDLSQRPLAHSCVG